MDPKRPPGDRTLFTEGFGEVLFENFKASESRSGKVPISPCSRCGVAPGEKERFSKCPRCKSMVYCSRQCQKDDWLEHKLSCSDAVEQRDFAIECILRMKNDSGFMGSLRSAIAEQFFETFVMESNPRKKLVVAAHLCLRPRELKDLDALKSPRIPLGPLIKKPMLGSLMMLEITDASDLDDHPLNERGLALWQETRNAMDRARFFDSYTAVVRFIYKGKILYILSTALHPYNLRSVGNGDWHEKGLQNPCIAQINVSLAIDDAISKKIRCLLGDDDKRFMREWASKSVI